MYARQLDGALRESAKSYPIVTLLGPRQSGKTTLVKAVFADKPYVNLEDPDIRLFAEEDPREFLGRYPQGAIFDEIQRVPKLLSYLQGIVDNERVFGKYILTGSHQFDLHAALTQSLAGRTAVLILLPLALAELRTYMPDFSIDDYIIRGFYPRVYFDKLEPAQYYRNYLQTYIERDVRQMINIKNLSQFQNFVKLCANRIAQPLICNNLASDIGVSNTTIKEWISILEASFIVAKLPPYFANMGKRLVKTPKFYFVDVGLAAFLLNINSITELQRSPLRGALIENLVVMDLFKARYNQAQLPNLYYYRDQQQHEVDVVFEHAHKLILMEIKAAKTFDGSSSLKNINYLQKLVPDKIEKSYLIYTGDHEQKVKGVSVINYLNAGNIV